MRISRTVQTAITVAGLALSLVAATENPDCWVLDPGDPADPDDDVVVCPEPNWFHDGGDGTRLGNLADAAGTARPTWDTTEPTSSFTDGAGASYVTGVRDGTPSQEATARFVGVAPAPVDTVAIELHYVPPARTCRANTSECPPTAPLPPHAGEVTALDIELAIDDQVVLDVSRQHVNTTFNEERGVGTLRFAVTDLHAKLDALGLADAATHSMELTVRPNDTVVIGTVDLLMLVYDAAEVPSSLTFNLNPTGSVLDDFTRIDA